MRIRHLTQVTWWLEPNIFFHEYVKSKHFISGQMASPLTVMWRLPWIIKVSEQEHWQHAECPLSLTLEKGP